MSQQVILSDELYEAVMTIAKAQGQTLEGVISSLVEDYLADPDADLAAGNFTSYNSTEAFMRALGADETLLAKARERDRDWAEQERDASDADV